jgi:acetyl-CoA carboxylase, biotin carboxylase subunit
MNTRLQVEHPITERVTGVDLVKQQIKIAQGEILHLNRKIGTNGDIPLNAEFMPKTLTIILCPPGKIYKISEPLGLGVRTDGYVYEGYEIPIYYDSMISKLIVWGKTREIAIQRMRRALYEYKITGVKTSIKFLEKIMVCKDFVDGNYDTHFIENNKGNLTGEVFVEQEIEDMVIISAYIDYLERLSKVYTSKEFQPANSRWKKSPQILHF